MNNEKMITMPEENKTQTVTPKEDQLVKQIFRFLATDGTIMHIEAYSYEDAIEEYRKYHGYC